MNFSATLLTVERVVVTVAALAALFPLWQFWDERFDREEERAALFIASQSTCLELLSSPEAVAMSRRDLPSELVIPQEIDEKLLEKIRARIEHGVILECSFLYLINPPES